MKNYIKILLFGFNCFLFAPYNLFKIIKSMKFFFLNHKNIYSFSLQDITIRSWYKKLSEDIYLYGRLGYVWDDGFGLSLNTRFYNNYLTYFLYNKFGFVCYNSLSILLYFLSIIFLFSLYDKLLIGILTCLILFISPLFIGAQIHMGKPEILWWFFFPFILFLQQYNIILLGIILSIISFANFSVYFFSMLCFFFFLPFLFPQIHSLNINILILSVLPGIIKTSLRIIPHLKQKKSKNLFKEQMNVVKTKQQGFWGLIKKIFRLEIIYYTFLYITSFLFIYLISPFEIKYVLFFLFLLLLYLISQCLVYIADPSSFWMLHISFLVFLIAQSSNNFSVISLIILLFIYPQFSYCPVPKYFRRDKNENLLQSLKRFNNIIIDNIIDFPYIKPVKYLDFSSILQQFYKKIDQNSRVAFETYSLDREMNGYRTFLQLSEYYLNKKSIEIIPDEYVRIDNFNFFDKIISQINPFTRIDDLHFIIKTIGAQYIIAFTSEFYYYLLKEKFELISTIDYLTLSNEQKKILKIPDNNLFLFKVPYNNNQIEPYTIFQKYPNKLEFIAKKNTKYLIKYSYSKNFKCFQNNINLEINSNTAFNNLDLYYIKIHSKTNGKILLTFEKKLFS